MCQENFTKYELSDSKLAPALSGQTIEPDGREPVVAGPSSCGIVAHCVDWKTLLSGMGGKDHPSHSADVMVQRWRRETASEELIHGIHAKLSYL